MIPYTQILKMYEYFRYLMMFIGFKSIIFCRACIKYLCTFFKTEESNFCNDVTTSLCKLPCTQQNKLFPSTQSDGLFMCSQSGKQIHIILIIIHVCFHIILMVYTLTVTYMPAGLDKYSSWKMFGLIHLQRFIPELKLRLFRFEKKQMFCTGENIIRFGSTLDAQIGVLTEKSRYLI